MGNISIFFKWSNNFVVMHILHKPLRVLRASISNIRFPFSPAYLIKNIFTKKPSKNLRNQKIAYICNRLVARNDFTMRRDIFQAIADPTRRAIIALIAAQAMTPNALAEHFDISRQAVSKHLQILAQCEVLSQQQRGREVYYQLDLEKMKEIDHWLEQFRRIWENRFEQLDHLLKTLQSAKDER